MSALFRRASHNRIVALAVLSSLTFSFALLGLPVFPFKQASSQGTTATGSPSGDAGDTNPATFKFREDNSDVRLTRANEVPVTLAQVPSYYGTPDGVRIYDNGVDVTSPGYKGVGGPKTPVGMNLSKASGWPNVYVPPGKVGIDPIRGRFKFYEKAWGDYDTGVALDVFVKENYAYVADGGDRGFQIIDVSDPGDPKLAGHFTTKTALGVFVSGKYAYMATAIGLQILDVSNPASPTLSARLRTENARNVFISGNYAYMTTLSGLKIINISNPGAPSLTGSHSTEGTAYGIFVRGNLAFVAAGGDGLRIVNISNPAAPTLSGHFKTDIATDVFVSGNYAYVAGGEFGLKIVDVSNPSSPTLAGSYETPGTAGKISVSGNRLYLADGEGGLQVMDISNPTRPTLFQSFDTPGSALGVFVRGNQVYLADHASGLQVIDMVAPASETPQGPVTADYNYASPGRVKTLEKGEITDFKTPRILDVGPAKFSLRFRNAGRLPLKPAGVIQIKSFLGKKVTLRIKGKNVLPKKARLFFAQWDDLPAVGLFSAQAKLKYGLDGKRILSPRASFFVFPWRILLVIGGVLILIFIGERRLRRQRS